MDIDTVLAIAGGVVGLAGGASLIWERIIKARADAEKALADAEKTRQEAEKADAEEHIVRTDIESAQLRTTEQVLDLYEQNCNRLQVAQLIDEREQYRSNLVNLRNELSKKTNAEEALLKMSNDLQRQINLLREQLDDMQKQIIERDELIRLRDERICILNTTIERLKSVVPETLDVKPKPK